MYLFRPPHLLRHLFYPTHVTWNRPRVDKKLYLTFDDGPIPEMTLFILETLAKYRAKATFFCVGDNVKKNPDIFRKILTEQHAVGNHTFNHLSGWHTPNEAYSQNIQRCQEQMQIAANGLPFKSNLFRPPYGRIKRSQIAQIATSYEIILWDTLTYDFDKRLAPNKCLKNAIKYTQEGSIIVMHDNIKAKNNVDNVLPFYLEHFSSLGYTFETL
jgi:peptidoglycan/xylan/chitin deacetylase (PgdA/CDA1 family)